MIKYILNIISNIFREPDFEDEDSEFLSVIMDTRFSNKPCAGNINDTGSWCGGCKFEKEHTGK